MSASIRFLSISSMINLPLASYLSAVQVCPLFGRSVLGPRVLLYLQHVWDSPSFTLSTTCLG